MGNTVCPSHIARPVARVVFAIIAFLIFILYLADVGGVHTLIFGGLLLGLTASANWCAALGAAPPPFVIILHI